jgi:hypothetical protein
MNWRTSQVPRAVLIVRELSVLGLLSAIQADDIPRFKSAPARSGVPLKSWSLIWFNGPTTPTHSVRSNNAATSFKNGGSKTVKPGNRAGTSRLPPMATAGW